MIYFNKKEQEDDNTLIAFRTSKDKSFIKDETIKILNNFLSFLQTKVLNSLIDDIYEITSIVRLILFENEIYKQKFMNKTLDNSSKFDLSFKHSSTTYLGLVAHQNHNLKKYMESFFKKTSLLNLIGQYILDKLKVKNFEKELEVLEINALLLLNIILFVIFNNAKVDILKVTDTEVPREEYLRLFQGILSNNFKHGWNFITFLSLQDINNYQNNLDLLLTDILCQTNISLDVKDNIELSFFSFKRKVA